MIKPASNIGFTQAKAMISQWPLDRKFKLLKDLRKETWEMELQEIFRKIDARRKKLKISKREILAEIEKGRREFYAPRS